MYGKITFVSSGYKGDSMEILSYFGQNIEVRDGDNYINAEQLCSTYNKRFRDWNKLKSAQEFLSALSEMTEQDGARKIPCTLIIQETDTIGGNGVTWIHPDLAIEVARWLNPKFGVWCNRKIRELLTTGKTQLDEELEQKRQEVASLIRQKNYYHDSTDLALKEASKAVQKGFLARSEVKQLEKQKEKLTFEVHILKSERADLIKINRRLKKEARA